MHQLFPQLLQQLLVRLSLHVAQRHIGAGAFRQLHPLQPQMGVPHPPPQQRGVLHQILHKPVVAAPQHPAGVWLLHGAAGEVLHVHEYAPVVPLHDH